MKNIKTYESFWDDWYKGQKFAESEDEKSGIFPPKETTDPKTESINKAYDIILGEIRKDYPDLNKISYEERDKMVWKVVQKYRKQFSDLLNCSVDEAEDLLYPRFLRHFVWEK